jgi:hypothetical protein
MHTFPLGQSALVLHVAAEVVSSKVSWTGKARVVIVKSESAVAIRLIERMVIDFLGRLV